jgi:ATP-dependent helicase/nuclease subunit B
LRHWLNFKSSRTIDFGAAALGTLLHRVMAEFFTRRLNMGAEAFIFVNKDDCEREIFEIVQKIAQTEIEREGDLLQLNFLLEKLYFIAPPAVWAAMNFYKQSGFKPFGCEVKFGENGDFDALKLSDENFSAEIEGSCDRIDVWRNSGGANFAVVIDYKLRKKRFDEFQFGLGAQLQPLVYMNAALCNLKDARSAGIFYMPLDAPILNIGGKDGLPLNFSEDDYDKKMFAKMKLDGLAVGEAQILEALDKSFAKRTNESGKSVKANASAAEFIAKDKKPSASKHLLSADEFDEKLKIASEKAFETAKNIASGKIYFNEVKRKNFNPCDCCDYSSACAQFRFLADFE